MKTNKPLLLSALFALAVVLLASVCVHADDAGAGPSGGGDTQAALAQLEEMLGGQAATETGDNALTGLQSLQAKLDRLQMETAARLGVLEEENQILKNEIERQHRRVETAEAARRQAEEDLERLVTAADTDSRKDAQGLADALAEVEQLKADLAAARADAELLSGDLAAARAVPSAESPDADRLKGELAAARSEAERLSGDLAAARAEVAGLQSRLAETAALSIDESRAGELAAALDDMRAVDVQRKAAMDDLFRQLAAQQRESAAKGGELVAAEERLSQANAMIGVREQELAARTDQLAAVEKELAGARLEQEALNAKLAEALRTAEAHAAVTSDRDVHIRALQQEMDRVILVDKQRRQTLDETLALLAEARQSVAVLSGELEKVRGEYAGAVRDAEARIESATSRKAVLDLEIVQMEKDVAEAQEARETAQAKAKEMQTELTDRERRIVDLEEQVSRLTAVDEQRRKAMDRILLDVAVLEQEKGRLQSDIQRMQSADAVRVAAGPAAGELEQELAGAQRENAALLARISALEAALQARGAEMASATAPEGETLSTAEPAVWRQERQQMEQMLREQSDALARDAERTAQLARELDQARQMNTDLAAQVQALGARRADIRESDLYKELEQINSMLREKMLEIEADRQRLSQSVAEASRLEAERAQAVGAESQARTKAEAALTEALAREDEYKELIERLVPQVEDLEKQSSELARERQTLTNRLRERDEDLLAMKVELERREHRLAKAERVAEVLEKARTEVMRAGEREKLNMHYNMASVYAREGKFTEAEREYLQALRIDPTDADVHYNLGILYDDELKQPEKATLHYRRYLQLSPHGPDADRVRNWLMKLDMRTQR